MSSVSVTWAIQPETLFSTTRKTHDEGNLSVLRSYRRNSPIDRIQAAALSSVRNPLSTAIAPGFRPATRHRSAEVWQPEKKGALSLLGIGAPGIAGGSVVGRHPCLQFRRRSRLRRLVNT